MLHARRQIHRGIGGSMPGHPSRSTRARIVRCAVAAAITLGLGAAGLPAAAADGLRPEVGKPLQAAQELIKAQKFKDALAKVREADAVESRTDAERWTIERMRIAAATGAGDGAAAVQAFEALQASGRLPEADKLRLIEAITGTWYRAGDHARVVQWAQRHAKEGGRNPAVRTWATQSLFLSGDHAGAARALVAEIQAAEAAGTAPAEDRIKLLLNAAVKLNDDERYLYSVEKLLTHYPKPQYWSDLLSRLQSRPQFNSRFALDIYRLALATGSLNRAEDYVEMAQLAAQAGFPAEGKRVVAQGFARGLLGTGAQAARHQRLRDLLDKRTLEDQAAWAQSEVQALAAEDGNALVKLGFNLALNGQGAKGVDLMQQGLRKGGLQAAEAAKLRLGIAQVLSGHAAKAHATFRSVAGHDGAADLARLWSLFARGKGTAA
jgi:hypothetical protein